MVAVFLSSTRKDLYAHRQVVSDRLREAGIHVIGMEHFSSQPGDAQQVSLAEVGRADVLVGLYAHRYGYRPDDDKSVTEMEYQEAQRAGLDCLIFLVEENYREGLLGQFAESDAEAINFLNNFKRRLSTKHVLQTFTSPDDLAGKVVAAVARWMGQRQADASADASDGDSKYRFGGEVDLSEGHIGDKGSAPQETSTKGTKYQFNKKLTMNGGHVGDDYTGTEPDEKKP
jgi:hypothetical protein